MRKCFSSSHTPCTCLQGCTFVLRCTRDNSDNHQTTPHQLHPAYSTTPMSTQQKHFYTAQRIAIPAQMHAEYPNMSTTHQLLTPDTKLSLHKQTAFNEPSPTAETRKSAMYTHTCIRISANATPANYVSVRKWGHIKHPHALRNISQASTSGCTSHTNILCLWIACSIQTDRIRYCYLPKLSPHSGRASFWMLNVSPSNHQTYSVTWKTQILINIQHRQTNTN